MALTAGQKEAKQAVIAVATRQSPHRQLVLAGFAGTGKTFLTQDICKDLGEAKYKIAAITYTNKALGVLSEALSGATPMTINQALSWRINGRTQEVEITGPSVLPNYDVVLVDESSMVSTEMRNAIVDATEATGTPIIWIGDPGQLPPVGEDSSPVFNDCSNQARLNQIVRQAEGSPIIAASLYVRRCLDDGERPTPEGLARAAADSSDKTAVTIQTGSQSTIASLIHSAINANLDARAICFTNAAVLAINREVVSLMGRSQYYSGGDPITFNQRHEFIDRRYHLQAIPTDSQGVVRKNNGIVNNHGPLALPCYALSVKVQGNEHLAHVPVDIETYFKVFKGMQGERSRLWKTDNARAKEIAAKIAACTAEYADIRHTYAMTAHKSQGSTFDVAVIHWRDLMKVQENRMLARMVYVAITRPSKYLVIVR